MNFQSSLAKRVNYLAYIIVLLVSVILILISKREDLGEFKTYEDFFFNIGIGLFVASILFFMLITIIAPNEAEEERNKKLDAFLSRNSQNQYSRVFVEKKDENFKENLYEFFTNKIKDAKSEISFAGVGFSGSGSKKIAGKFFAACYYALKNDVHITRLQTTNRISEYWAIYLKDLLKNKNFKLFLKKGSWTHGSICCVDPHNVMNNVSEYMLEVDRLIRNESTKKASIVVFIEKNSSVAKDINDLIHTYTSNNEFAQRVTIENFDTIMKITDTDDL